MRHYFAVYKYLLKMNFSQWIVFRSSFIQSATASLGYGLLMIYTMVLLTSRVSVVNGWSREELIVLACSYSLVVTLFHMLFARNFDRFSSLVHRGELDSILLKPMDSQFLVSAWLFHYPNVVRILVAICIDIYLINIFQFKITLISFLSFIILGLCSVMLLYAIWFMIATLTIWVSYVSNFPSLLYSITTVARFPKEIYEEISIYVFAFLLPLSLIVGTPTKALIQKSLGGDLFLLITFSVTLFLLSRVFWKFALRSYTSASS